MLRVSRKIFKFSVAKNALYFLALFLIFSLCFQGGTEAQQRNQRNKEFLVPEKLRGRVNFWKDIFTQYGKAHIVIHHRDFPQIIFMVVDLSKEFESMSAVAFDGVKKSAERKYVGEVKEAIEYLSRDAQPQTYLQKFISGKMQFLGPGTAKYKKVLQDDLIRTQTGIKEKFEGSVKRAGRYLPLIERIFVEDFGLPVELTRLPFIESSFDYTAYSSVGAAGIWQFMPRTGKLYMTINKVVDERRDPLEASRAAAKYLKDAYSRLGNWPLAITSYNHGVAGVKGKVSRMGTSDIVALIENKNERVFGFASSNFYPEFLAAVEIYDNYLEYFPGLQIEQPIKAREVKIERAVSAPYIAQQMGVHIDALKAVNYALASSVWQGKQKIPAGYRLKVPDKTDLHLAYLRVNEPEPAKPQPATSVVYSGLTYKVRKGDTLIAISKKYGTSVSDLKALNNIDGKNLKIGQILTVKAKEGSAQTETVVRNTKSSPSSSLPSVNAPVRKFETYKVKKGDSLWSISIKQGIGIDELRKLNKDKISGGSLTAGQIITIPKK